jgi:hypothetical protein
VRQNNISKQKTHKDMHGSKKRQTYYNHNYGATTKKMYYAINFSTNPVSNKIKTAKNLA